jgi:hypothetical protein
MSSAAGWSFPKPPASFVSSPREKFHRFAYPRLWEKARAQARASLDRDYKVSSQDKAWQAEAMKRTQYIYDILCTREVRNDAIYAASTVRSSAPSSSMY